MRRVLTLVLLVPGFCACAAQTTVSFDPLLPAPGMVHNDSPVSAGPATFDNITYESWGMLFWAGYAFSTVSNTTANSHTNQYAAAQARSNAYAVAYNDGWNPPPTIRFDLPVATRSPSSSTTPPTPRSRSATAWVPVRRPLRPRRLFRANPHRP
jgi:hypothetical protein